MVSVLPSCVPAQQRREGSARSPPLPPVAAHHVTSALWHVAVLNHRAIIWCQVAQRAPTSVTALRRGPVQHAAARRRLTLFPQLRSPTLSAVTRHPSGKELCICMHCVPRSVFLCWPRNVSSTENCKYKGRYALCNHAYILY